MWPRLKEWFQDSETLALARLQVAAGFILSVAGLLASSFADPAIQSALQDVIPAHYWPYILIGMGLLTEYLRRRRASDMR